MAHEGYDDQMFELARLQRERTDRLPPDLIDNAFRFARRNLPGSALPDELTNVPVLLYLEAGLSGLQGGGIQFNHNGLGVRARAYRIEDEAAVAEFPFDDEEVDILIAATEGLYQRAGRLGRLSLSPDLTIIRGFRVPPKIIQVPLQIE
jgi:hypothetical protein